MPGGLCQSRRAQGARRRFPHLCQQHAWYYSTACGMGRIRSIGEGPPSSTCGTYSAARGLGRIALILEGPPPSHWHPLEYHQIPKENLCFFIVFAKAPAWARNGHFHEIRVNFSKKRVRFLALQQKGHCGPSGTFSPGRWQRQPWGSCWTKLDE